MSDDLKDKFKEAAAIASSVPKEFRQTAFNRALDALMIPRDRAPAATIPQPPKVPVRKAEAAPKSDTGERLSELDRTRHPNIVTSPRVLERALHLLRAARDDHDLDGLGATEIAKVLSEKFRLRTTRQAVTQALDAAGDKVDRRKLSDRTVIYRLMHAGDQYLDSADIVRTKRAPKNPASKARKAGRPKKASPPTELSPESRSTVTNGKAGARTGRPGPGEILKTLVAAGFFSEHRSIADIQSHCERKLAHRYGVNELSTPLRRAVHNGLLQRDENEDGQYEYSTP